ncbi:MAG: SRPBCC domain-containing protein [Dehalococcoidia bacterium]
MTDQLTETTHEEPLTVERVFAAPRALVWRAWTEPARMQRWYGPQGMTQHVCEIDFRIGGRYLYGLRSAEGWEYYTTGTYEDIVPLERFTASESLSDAAGNPVAPPHYGMPDGTPATMTIIVTFEDAPDGGTKLTLRHLGWPDASMAAGAGGGWNQAFDKLQAVLAEAG